MTQQSKLDRIVWNLEIADDQLRDALAITNNDNMAIELITARESIKRAKSILEKQEAKSE